MLTSDQLDVFEAYGAVEGKGIVLLAEVVSMATPKQALALAAAEVVASLSDPAGWR